jgi:Lrp/AsnC family transcriptional regulator for asnA, asnC and gidA
VVVGSSISLDFTKLGFDVTAFIGIHLESSSMFESVSDQLKFIPEIVAANYTTGAYGIFAKVICRDTPHLRTVLHDKIQKINGVQRTETFISLQECINRPLDIMAIE